MRIGMSKQNQQNNDFRRLFPTLLRHLLKLKKKKIIIALVIEGIESCVQKAPSILNL